MRKAVSQQFRLLLGGKIRKHPNGCGSTFRQPPRTLSLGLKVSGNQPNRVFRFGNLLIGKTRFIKKGFSMSDIHIDGIPRTMGHRHIRHGIFVAFKPKRLIAHRCFAKDNISINNNFFSTSKYAISVNFPGFRCRRRGTLYLNAIFLAARKLNYNIRERMATRCIMYSCGQS